MVWIIQLWPRGDKHGLAIHGFPHLALEIDAEQLRPRLIDEAISLAFDLDDVGVFRDRPEWTIAIGLGPVDRVVAPQPGKQPVLRVDAAIGLMIGDCIVQRPVEHRSSSLCDFRDLPVAPSWTPFLTLPPCLIPRPSKSTPLDEPGDCIRRQTEHS